PDARHTRHDDVLALADLCRARGVEFNLEGNPFAPPREGYAGFVALCERVRPAQATLVPDADAQLTSDHGFDFARNGDALRPLVARLGTLGCRVSLFADAGCDVAHAAAIGADRIELYTGPWAEAFAVGREVGAQPHHHRLGFRIAKADVELDDLRCTGGVDHQSGVEETGERHAVRRHPAHGGLDHLAHDPRVHLRRHHRRRGVGAHAAGIGAGVAIADALVVLAGGHWQRGGAVDDGDEAGLLAVEEFLDHHPRAGRAERVAGQHVAHRQLRFLQRRGDDDA